MDSLPLAAIVFVAAHILISGTPLRDLLTRWMGPGPYQAFFSLIALATLVWLIRAYGAAVTETLWAIPALRWAPLVLMPFSLMLLVAGLTAPNPSMAGQAGLFKDGIPARGVFRVTRHPVQIGIALWALGHLVANGDSAALWFFGALLALSVAGSISLDRKKSRLQGEAWVAFSKTTSLLPFAAILGGRNTLKLGEIGWWRLGLGLAVYVILILVHANLFGVAAF